MRLSNTQLCWYVEVMMTSIMIYFLIMHLYLSELILEDHISWAVTSTRTIASSTVPFSRDPKFVARNSIITKLDSILKTPGSHNRAALFGLGGIG